MCTFVSLVVATSDAERLNAVVTSRNGRGHARDALALASPALGPLLLADEREYWLNRAPCDCGTWLGSASITPDTDIAKIQETYRRKGWTEARIARAVADKLKARATSETKARNEDAAYWIDLVAAIAAEFSVKRIGLMHHFYRKGPGVDIFRTRRESGGAIWTADRTLATMEDGVLYDFDCSR